MAHTSIRLSVRTRKRLDARAKALGYIIVKGPTSEREEFLSDVCTMLEGIEKSDPPMTEVSIGYRGKSIRVFRK